MLPYRKVQGKLFLFIFWVGYCILGDIPGSSVVKKLPANAGDMGSIPELGRSLGEGNDNPFQCSCLENPRDSGTLQGYSLCGCKRVGHDLATEQH